MAEQSERMQNSIADNLCHWLIKVTLVRNLHSMQPQQRVPLLANLSSLLVMLSAVEWIGLEHENFVKHFGNAYARKERNRSTSYCLIITRQVTAVPYASATTLLQEALSY